MRSAFLISAILLHISWSNAYYYPSWEPNYYNPFGYPDFINRYKIEEMTKPNVDKISGLSDVEVNKPGTPGAPPGHYYSISHSSFETSKGDGKVHKEGETVINKNGQITKFKD